MSDDAFTQTTRILRVLLDEYKAPPMALVALANVRKIEAGWQELRARIATLESERDALRERLEAAEDLDRSPYLGTRTAVAERDLRAALSTLSPAQLRGMVDAIGGGK